MKYAEFKPYVNKKEGKICIDGVEVLYDVICEEQVVWINEKPVGTMFSYSYIKKNVKSDDERPVLFAYNGGPGSSACWLHMGLLGVKRVHFDSFNGAGRMLDGAALEDNSYSILRDCDIVLIDPLGTGYSIIFDEEQQYTAYAAQKDAELFADFIEDWLQRYNRWKSPKYLLGESYGTMRSCYLLTELAGGVFSSGKSARGISVDGVILMGTAICANPKPGFMDEFGIEPSVLDLPSFAAANWYYLDIKPEPFADYVEGACRFAETEYLTGLCQGNRLPETKRLDLEEKLSYYTGLPGEFLRQKSYRISGEDFAQNRLAVNGQVIGMYDSRLTMPWNSRNMADPVGDDGSMAQYTPPYRAAFMEYCSDFLNLNLDRNYKMINFDATFSWKYDYERSAFAQLQNALCRDRNLRVLVINGWYDLKTTIGRARYMLAQLGAERSQITAKEYESGHMMYLDNRNCQKLVSDIKAFIADKAVFNEKK